MERCCRSHLWQACVVGLCCFVAVAPLRGDETLTRTVIPGESPGVAQRLEAARKQARDQDYAAAVEEYQRLIEEAGDKLAPLNTQHLVQARWLSHRDIAAWPEAGLKLYRNRVDAQARKWFTEGAAARDPALLRRVVDETFCSSVTDQALDLLGDLALERGDFTEADRWWQRLTPPVLLVEAGKKPAANLELLYPDPKVDLARVHARQILARFFQGPPHVNLEDLHAELAAFRRLHPHSEGQLAGRQGNYGDTLEQLLAQPFTGDTAATWTSFAGGPSRNLVLPPEPDDPNRLLRLWSPRPAWCFHLEDGTPYEKEEFPPSRRADQSPRALAFYPLIVGNQVLVADAACVRAYDLKTGKSETWYDVRKDNGGVDPDLKLPTDKLDLRYTLTVAEDCVFARLGVQDIRHRDADARDRDSFLVCLSLRPDRKGNRLRWFTRPAVVNTDGAVFEGAPVVRDGRAYIAATRFVGGRVITAIHCYPVQAATAPPLRWRQDVCETPEQKEREEPRYRHHLLTLAGTNVVYCSHNGAIVALDAASGRPAWAVRYPARPLPEATANSVPRDLAPCLYAAGRLYIAPEDSDTLFCLDAATGEVLWKRDPIPTVHLLGVASGRLIFTTPQGIRAVDAITGLDQGGWLRPNEGILRPFGRGFLAGYYVFWPTQRRNTDLAEPRLYVLNQTDGDQPDELLPGQWQTIPAGNLVYADGCLAVADTEYLYIYLTPALRLPQREGEVQSRPRSAVTHYERALAELDTARRLRDRDTGSWFSHVLEDLQEAGQLAGREELWQGQPLAEQIARTRREVWREKARAAGAAQRWQEAAEDLAHAASPEYPPPQRREALGELADLWVKAGQPARAVAVWQGILEDDRLRSGRMSDGQGREQPTDLLAAARIAGLIRQHGRSIYDPVEQRARALLEGVHDEERPTLLRRLARQFPNAAVTTSALLELARQSEKAGRPGAAAEAYRRVLGNEPDNAVALSGLAHVYEQQHCWAAARSTWQRLASQQGERTIAALAPNRPVRAYVEEQLAQPIYQSCSAPLPPNPPLPLTHGWHLPLAADERLLLAAPEEEVSAGCPGPTAIFFTRGRDLLCREAATGKLRWSRTLPDAPHWLGQHADTVLAAGARAVAALRLDAGEVIWQQTLSPTEESLSEFHLATGRLFYLQGERRLFAVDAASGWVLWARWAHGAHLDLPYPSGRFFPSYHAGPDRVIAQLAGGLLWVLDSHTGRTLHELPTSREPWPRPPLVVGERQVYLVAGTHEVVLLDPEADTAPLPLLLPAPSTLSGQPPLLVRGPQSLLLVLFRNYGPTLQRLDPATGKALWPQERYLGSDLVTPGGITCDGERVYVVNGDFLQARTLADGQPLWTVPLLGPGRVWQLRPTEGYLLAYPADVGARRLELFTLFGSAEITGTFPLTTARTIGWPVLCLEPETGRLVQRCNCRSAGPRTVAQGDFDPSHLFPELRLRKPVFAVQRVEGGLVGSVAGDAWGKE